MPSEEQALPPRRRRQLLFRVPGCWNDQEEAHPGADDAPAYELLLPLVPYK